MQTSASGAVRADRTGQHGRGPDGERARNLSARRRPLWFAASLSLVLLATAVAACSAGGDGRAPAATASGQAQPEQGPPRDTPPTGTVQGERHLGDLRFFLLPLPDGARSSGNREGEAMTLDEVAVGYDENAAADLRSSGFQAAAHRSYATPGGNTEVDIRLIRFSSPTAARSFAERHPHDGPQVSVPGDPRARAARLVSASAESSDALVAVSYEGDVHITLTVTGMPQPTPAHLAALLQRQYERLRTGR